MLGVKRILSPALQVQVWFDLGANMVQVWYNLGANMVQLGVSLLPGSSSPLVHLDTSHTVAELSLQLRTAFSW